MTYILGLTGGIASGKSTVSTIFKEKGIPVIDADIIARQVVGPKSSVLEALGQTFGKDYINTDGQLNRQKLGQLVFNNSSALEKLNEIMIPVIKEKIIEQIKSQTQLGSKLIVLDIPLLFEQNYQGLCDGVMVCFVPEEVQIRRLIDRDKLTLDEGQARIKAQLPIQMKKDLADFVIDNATTVADTRSQVIKWLSMQNNR